MKLSFLCANAVIRNKSPSDGRTIFISENTFYVQEISLRPENMKFFALFEIFDQNFERKIQPNEFPHSLYMSNYSTAAPSCIRLVDKKWRDS
jgi:hypothetical protein